MYCAWDRLLAVLPPVIRNKVDKLGKSELQELRLRLGEPVELVCKSGITRLTDTVSGEMLSFVVNTASRYSPWAAETAASGFITAPGGHRIGLAGECVIREGKVTGVRTVRSVCIRIARDLRGVSAGVPLNVGSVLILGPPGSGKTTLLRDLIRRFSDGGQAVAVVDERGELFPPETDFLLGKRTDVVSFASKTQGIDMALRTLSPERIAVDEITSAEDCNGLLRAMWCGVSLMATAHAGSIRDLRTRTVYKPLVETGAFQKVLLLKPDKSWQMERMDL